MLSVTVLVDLTSMMLTVGFFFFAIPKEKYTNKNTLKTPKKQNNKNPALLPLLRMNDHVCKGRAIILPCCLHHMLVYKTVRVNSSGLIHVSLGHVFIWYLPQSPILTQRSASNCSIRNEWVSECETPSFTLPVEEIIKAAQKTTDTNLPFDICLNQNVHKSQKAGEQEVFLRWIIVPITCTHKTKHLQMTRLKTAFTVAPVQVSKKLLTHQKPAFFCQLGFLHVLFYFF